MKELTLAEMIEICVCGLGISEETISAISSINGAKKQSFEELLYWATGYHTFEQYLEGEM